MYLAWFIQETTGGALDAFVFLGSVAATLGLGVSILTAIHGFKEARDDKLEWQWFGAAVSMDLYISWIAY